MNILFVDLLLSFGLVFGLFRTVEADATLTDVVKQVLK